jgi:cystathionine beta-lyase/cystathionine gamma-synthase
MAGLLNAARERRRPKAAGISAPLRHRDAVTHSGLTPEDKLLGGITDNLVRLSIGIEHHEDLIRDLDQALVHA